MNNSIRPKSYWNPCLIISLSLVLVFGAGAGAESDQDEVVAILNNAPIYRSEVEQNIAFKLYRLRGSIYRIMQRETEAIIDRRLLEAQAAREGLSVEQLLENEINAKVKPPGEQAVSEYLNRHPKEGVDPEQLRIRARTYLHQRAMLQRRLDYLASLRAAADLKFVLAQPRMRRMKIEVEDQPWRGNARAPVTLVHFSDLTSRLCQQSARNIQRAMKAFPDKIKWVHRGFLNRMDENALAAAQAGVQAHEQGKFWEYHDAILNLNAVVDRNDIERIAADLGLSLNVLEGVQQEGRSLLKLKNNLAEANRIGVRAAPVIFVNGIYYSGTFSYGQLKSLIMAELVGEKKRLQGAKIEPEATVPKH